MRAIRFLIPLLVAVAASGQTPCPPTPKYSPCEIAIELSAADLQQHKNPYASVEMYAEMRSPEYKTFRVPAFWDGSRMVLRFAPNETGKWVYKLTSNVASWDGKIGEFQATDSPSLGFIRRANVYHWAFTGDLKPHLWMGDTCYRCAWMDRATFDATVAKRAEQKFTHIRVLVLPWDDDVKNAFTDPSSPNAAYFKELDSRIAALNAKGIVADLILGGDSNALVKLFPERDQRERYLLYIVARYAPYNVTWQIVQEYEEYERPREIMQELGAKLKELDWAVHPRSTHTLQSSSALVDDGWMTHILYQSSDDALGVIEHQQYGIPQVNTEFGYEDSGAGKSHAHHIDTATFRKRLWNATMNGQYPTFGNTGTYGGRKFTPDARYLDSPGAKLMTIWADTMLRTRYWDMTPYFDVDGGRAIAVPDTEYLVYIDKPGPVEVQVERHSYQVYWIDPSTGEVKKEKKDFKDHIFKGSPPTSDRDWILHLSRDGRKEGMLRSYKFESRVNDPYGEDRRIRLQDLEYNPRNMPFELVLPKTGDSIVAGEPVQFEIKTTKQTAGTRRMTYLLKGDVAAGGQGFRFLASGLKGTFTVPPSIFKSGPTSFTLRVFALNAPGKLYSIDTVLTIRKKGDAE